MMTVKHFTTVLASAAVTFSLTACSGSSDTATPTGPSKTPTSTSTASPSVKPSATAKPTTTTPAVVTYKGDALKAFDQATVNKAVEVAIEAAQVGVSNTTVLTNQAHKVEDFAPVTQFLTPDGLAKFKASYKGYLAKDKTAADKVFELSVFQDAEESFIIDPTQPLTAYNAAADKNVALDVTTDTDPHMVVTVRATVTYKGVSKGTAVTHTYKRVSTYSMVPTGNPESPVLVDEWFSDTRSA